MLITYLGHSGFCVELAKSTIIMDPWLSLYGAFDSAWFQYPCNHHLKDLVERKLQDTTKDRYIYISHEHQDHFDLAFLNSLQTRDFKFIVPQFRRSGLFESLAHYQCRGVILCRSDEEVRLADGFIKLYLYGYGFERDSAILVHHDGQSFLNLNDCRLYDHLQEIRKGHGDIDVVAGQFSGASWHPTCYDYPEQVYQRISQKKTIIKFEAIARAIEAINARIFLPSSGPPCFLDPMLFHLNLEPINVFSRPPQLIRYLQKRFNRSERRHTLEVMEMMPGDVLDVTECNFAYKAQERLSEDGIEAYLRSYAARYEVFFRDRQVGCSSQHLDDILNRLREAIEYKLSLFELSHLVTTALYLSLHEAPDKMIRVDFQSRRVEIVSGVIDPNYYSLSTPSWQMERVLDGKMTWYNFSLTFRMRIKREPDVYVPLLHDFLLTEAEDLKQFCSEWLELEAKLEENGERITVEAGGCLYSVSRFCPHQGADLSEGWIEENRYLVCPGHWWRFDLWNEGRCEASHATINAVALEQDGAKPRIQAPQVAALRSRVRAQGVPR